MKPESPRVVRILYKNHRGETAYRRIIPAELSHKATTWHPQPQWVLEALDLDKNTRRSFVMRDVLEWVEE